MPHDSDNVEYDAFEGDWKESHSMKDVREGRWVSGRCRDCHRPTTSSGWTTSHTSADVRAGRWVSGYRKD